MERTDTASTAKGTLDTDLPPSLPPSLFPSHHAPQASEAYTSGAHAALIDELWDALREIIYSVEPAKEVRVCVRGELDGGEVCVCGGG